MPSWDSTLDSLDRALVQEIDDITQEIDDLYCDAYYTKTETIVLVPVVVKYHEPTGIVYSYVPPTWATIEQTIVNKGKVP